MSDLPLSLTSVLNQVNDNPDDENKAFLLAAATNLYLEALRRFHGRNLLGPGDMRAILEMAHTMIIHPPAQTKSSSPIAKELTTAEKDQLLNAAVPPNSRRV